MKRLSLGIIFHCKTLQSNTDLKITSEKLHFFQPFIGFLREILSEIFYQRFLSSCRNHELFHYT